MLDRGEFDQTSGIASGLVVVGCYLVFDTSSRSLHGRAGEVSIFFRFFLVA